MSWPRRVTFARKLEILPRPRDPVLFFVSFLPLFFSQPPAFSQCFFAFLSVAVSIPVSPVFMIAKKRRRERSREPHRFGRCKIERLRVAELWLVFAERLFAGISSRSGVVGARVTPRKRGRLSAMYRPKEEKAQEAEAERYHSLRSTFRVPFHSSRLARRRSVNAHSVAMPKS